MPLKRGSSKKTVVGNISELIKAYKGSGKIGTTKPKSLAHARKIASAIAYSKAGIKKKITR
jgi:hypothetical protein